MQARLHRHRFNPPLLSHITVIHPEIHAGHRIDTLPQELQYVSNFLDVMLQRFPFPVHGDLAGHEHPDLCLISIHAGIHQLCVLFLDHFSVKIQIQDIPEVFQLFRIQMRRHFCEHILDDFFYHNKPLLYTDIVKDRGFLCQLLTQLYSDLNTTNNNLSKLGNLRFLAANTFTDAWNKAEAGYTYFIDIILDTSNADSPITAANRWFGQMWKNDTGKYGWQVAWSFNGTIYKRERNNSDAWTDWNTYALKSDLNNVSNKLMLDGMQTLSVKWANSDTLEFYVDNTRVFGILAKWVEITHKS